MADDKENKTEGGQTPPADPNKGKVDLPDWARKELDEARDEAKKYRRELREFQEAQAKMEEERKKAEEAQLKEQGKWQQIAEAQATELENRKNKEVYYSQLDAAFKATLEARLTAIPEKMRSLVPEGLTPVQLMAWLDKNAALLTKPHAPNLNPGEGRPDQQAGNVTTLTPQQLEAARLLNVKPEEYAKQLNAKGTTTKF